METGVVSTENMSHVLRSISQRRRQGVLSINYPQGKVHIYFIQGKVVEVVEDGKVPAKEVLARIKDAGFAAPDVAKLAVTYADLLGKLSQSRSGSRVLDEKLFKQVIKHRVLDKLYSLDMASGAYYTFEVEMVECERDYVPSVSVGQLLLDLVALQTDSDRFTASFPGDALVHQLESLDAALSEEEKILFDVIGDGITVDDLCRNSLISRYHLQDGLLGMYERGIIEVSKGGKSAHDGGREPLGNELFAGLEGAIDSAFEGVLDSDTEGAAISESPTVVPSKEKVVSSPKVTETAELKPVPLVYHEGTEQKVTPRKQGRATFGLSSARLLQASWVPHLLVCLFIASALIFPFLFWTELFYQFGH